MIGQILNMLLGAGKTAGTAAGATATTTAAPGFLDVLKTSAAQSIGDQTGSVLKKAITPEPIAPLKTTTPNYTQGSSTLENLRRKGLI